MELLGPHQINYEISRNSNSLLRLPFIITFGEITILGLTGIFLSGIQFRKGLLLSLFIIVYSFSAIAFLVVGRYRPLTIPPLAILGGFTIYYIFDKIKGKEYRKIIFTLLSLILVTGIVHYQVFLKKIQMSERKKQNCYIKTERGFILKKMDGNFMIMLMIWH